MPSLSPQEIAAFLVAVSFAAGLNVYATAGALGLMGRLGVLALPGDLGVLSSWWIIGICAALWAVEFIVDKIPAIDVLWNAAQAFVRVPIASLLAYAGATDLGPGWQLAAAAAGAALATAATSGKTATHASVAASPEPFTNVAISLAEDAFVIFIVWFATEHPFLAAAIVLVMLAAVILAVRAIIRVLRAWRARHRATGPSAIGSSSA
jgi:hypothetical protein